MLKAVVFLLLFIATLNTQIEILDKEFKNRLKTQDYKVQKSIIDSIDKDNIHTDKGEYYWLDVKSSKLKSLEKVGVGTAVKIKYLTNGLFKIRYIIDIENLEKDRGEDQGK